MSVEGRLDIRVLRSNGRTARAEIRSSRPRSLASIFVGRQAADAVRMLPQLYSVCAIAQGAAAATACEQAAGINTASATALARQLLVDAETWREHLLRILLDWQPDTAGISTRLPAVMRPLPELLARLSRQDSPLTLGAGSALDPVELLTVVETMEAISGDMVFGEPPERFLARESLADLETWCLAGATPAAQALGDILAQGWQSAGNGRTSFLPAIPDEELLARLLADDSLPFAAKPAWQGLPRETTPYSRQAERPLVRALAAHCGNGLVTRMTALLVEVATLPVGMRATLASSRRRTHACRSQVPVGCGVAQIEAARGRLAHAVEIVDGTVTRYGILAPTEWNFHADGTAARALENLNAAEAEGLTRQADLLIHAIDPCVGYRLEWSDA